MDLAFRRVQHLVVHTGDYSHCDDYQTNSIGRVCETGCGLHSPVCSPSLKEGRPRCEMKSLSKQNRYSVARTPRNANI